MLARPTTSLGGTWGTILGIVY